MKISNYFAREMAHWTVWGAIYSRSVDFPDRDCMGGRSFARLCEIYQLVCIGTVCMRFLRLFCGLGSSVACRQHLFLSGGAEASPHLSGPIGADTIFH
jgi:hypothetical protein